MFNANRLSRLRRHVIMGSRLRSSLSQSATCQLSFTPASSTFISTPIARFQSSISEPTASLFHDDRSALGKDDDLDKLLMDIYKVSLEIDIKPSAGVIILKDIISKKNKCCN